MTDEEKRQLVKQWILLEFELQGIHAGKVVKGTDPATREDEIDAEQELIEEKLGADWHGAYG